MGLGFFWGGGNAGSRFQRTGPCASTPAPRSAKQQPQFPLRQKGEEKKKNSKPRRGEGREGEEAAGGRANSTGYAWAPPRQLLSRCPAAERCGRRLRGEPRGGAEPSGAGAASRGGQRAAGCGLRRGSTRGSRAARTRRAGPCGPRDVRGGMDGLLRGRRPLGLRLVPGREVGGKGLHQPPIFGEIWVPPKCTLLGEAVLLPRNVMARLRGRVARLRVMWHWGGQGCAQRFCKGKRPSGRAACLDGEIFEVSTLLLLRCA